MHPLKETRHIAWARLEQVNLGPEDEYDDSYLYFSAFVGSSEQLLAMREQAGSATTRVSRRAVAASFRKSLPGLALLRVNRQAFSLGFFDGRRLQPHRWYELRFTATSTPGAIAVTSAGLGLRRWVAAAAMVDLPDLDNFFEAVFSDSHANQAKLTALLGASSTCSQTHPSPIASVVDVGQGSMVAVFANAQPRLFFDYGWPLSFYAATAPARPTPPAPDAAPVVLSHWDFDHWSFPFAGFVGGMPTWMPGEVDREWLVPGIGPSWGHVGLTPSAMAWVLELFINGKLWVWPAKRHRFTLNHLTIARTRPRKAWRGTTNSNGLCMLLHDRVQNDKQPGPNGPRAVLLPGDASYRSIQLGLGRSLKAFDWRGLLVTHHGATLKARLIPVCVLPGPKALPHSWLAVSSGPPAYGHPKVSSQARYLGKGHWRQQLLTHNRVDRLADDGSPDPRGNIELTIEEERQIKPNWHPSLAPRQ